MIVTLLEVAGSLPGNTGSKAKPWDPNGLYIWNPLLVLRDSSSEGLAPDAPLRPAAEAQEGLQLDSLEQFFASRPETGAPQCFYPFEVRTQEETGSTRRL